MAAENQPGPESTDAAPAPTTVAPGALSALLAELVRAPREAPAEPPAGTIIGRFELLRKLGIGGFGVVWEARDRQLGRSVAFKLVRPGEQADQREQTLLREAEAAARLSHDNLAALYDVGKSAHGPYLVFELLHGRTLAERLTAGPLPRAEALRILRDVTRGTAHAHREGVVHRDLKPANVFLCDDGRVKVLDFGLAHAFGLRRLSGGTPAYMAPEQWREAPEDERTDVFALGVMAYQLMAGTLPFADEKGTIGSRPAPALVVPGAPALGALVARMLEKDPVRRPRDAGALLEVLAATTAALERAGAEAEAAPVRTRRHPRWRVAGLVAGGALLGLLAAGGLLLARRPAPTSDGRVAVAVADFANPTGDREFDALSGLLITSLEQSRGLRVVTRGRMLDVLKQAGKGRVSLIDEGLALEVARREGVAALLLPSVRRLGDQYVVELRALDPSLDRTRFSARETAGSKAGLLPIIDRLAERTRVELREPGGRSEAAPAPVAGSVTASLEAYQHYFLGEQLYDELKISAALPEFQQALSADPTFSLAHYGISRCQWFLAAPAADFHVHADAAAAAADRLPAKEALLVRAWRARVYARRPEARALYDQALERYPEDKHLLLWAGNVELNGGDPARGLDFYRRALQLDPGSRRIRRSLVILLSRLGRLDEATDFVRRWEVEFPGQAATCSLVEVEVARHDLQAALAAARRCPDEQLSTGNVWRQSEFWVELLREDLAAAAAVAGRGRSPGRAPTWEDAFLAAAQGRQREAERLARQADQGEKLTVAFHINLLAARGRTPELADAVRKLRASTHQIDHSFAGVLAAAHASDPSVERESGGDERWPGQLIEAAALADQGDLAGARVILERRLADPLGLDRLPAAYALAETCHALGDARCVLAAAEAFRYPDQWFEFYFAWRSWGWPRALYWSAAAHQRLGELDQARGKVERLLRHWRRADPDLPLLGEARALCVALGCRP
ncbi:MAG: protein kinase [Anaeromyxobacter sp.]|nr:protein kinase [Anaeromyxobacter sp.]